MNPADLPAASIGTYPQDLEQWWLAQAGRHLNLREPKAIAKRLVDSAGILSDLFTTQRSQNFKGAYEGRLPVIAYGNYFFPQTYVRTRYVLSEWLAKRPDLPEKNPLKILDLGGGSGPALLSAADLFSSRFPGRRMEATLIDASADNLRQFQFLVQDLRSSILPAHRRVQGDLRDSSLWNHQSWDLILASFSLNEAFAQSSTQEFHAWVENACSALNEHGILVLIEPALRESSERLERLRDLIAAQGTRSIIAPCPHHRNCPLLAGKKYWCHDARQWPLPPMVQRINAVLKRSLWDLKYSFLILGKNPQAPATPTPARFRLTSSFTKEKGKISASGCAADGSNPRYEILRNRIEAAELRLLEKHERGDLLEITNLQTLGDGHSFRIAEPSAVQVLFQTRT